MSTRSGTSKKVVAELRAIAARNGGIVQPEAVVAAAKKPTSAMHGWFTWDDGEAAEKWRLHQARNLLRVTVEYLADDKAEEPVRVFVSLRSDAGVGYRRTADVMTDDELRDGLLSEARDDMESFKAKYRRLNELSAVFEAMEAATKAAV